jgi:hypothetical protein
MEWSAFYERFSEVDYNSAIPYLWVNETVGTGEIRLVLEFITNQIQDIECSFRVFQRGNYGENLTVTALHSDDTLPTNFVKYDVYKRFEITSDGVTIPNGLVVEGDFFIDNDNWSGTDLSVANGGTGAANASGARTNLGLVIGSDVQPFSNELTGIAAAVNDIGFYVRLGTGSVTERTLTAGANGIAITNGNGVAGNPVINISNTASITLGGLTTGALTTSSITKSGTNGTGDIGQTGNRFGTIFGTATSARYADLAEKYTTDQEYEPGTVLAVATAGDAESTATWQSGQRVLGVISTNPAFLMNDEAAGQAIALRGRVPVKVIGPIRKGQPLICNQDGKGIYGDTCNSFAIALETNEEHGVKLVECVIL